MEEEPNFTPKAQRAISKSKDFAFSLNDPVVNPDHLLLVMLEMQESSVNSFLTSFGFSFEQLKNFTIRFRGIKKTDQDIENVEFSESFNELLQNSQHFSLEIGHSYICIDHIFFALFSSNLTHQFLYL